MTDKKVHEHFLAFLHAECLDAASLSDYIRELLDTCKSVSQGYDGASVMSGRHNGIQARVRSFARMLSIFIAMLTSETLY